MRNVERAGGVESLAYRLVREMGEDNGCIFYPTAAQLRALQASVHRMSAAGCQFTDADVELLTAGEVSERDRALSVYDGYTSINRTLGHIFNGRTS